MATFPALTPSSRTFTPGTYPHSEIPTLSGLQTRVMTSNVQLNQRLRLSFAALTETEMLSIRTHYIGQQGRFISFFIPNELLSGMSTPASFTPTGYSWTYVAPPQISDVACGRYDVSVELATVPPEGVNVNGAELAISASLAFAGAGGGAEGATLTVAATFEPGRMGNEISIPAAGLGLEGHEPEQIGRPKTIIQSATAPTISLGGIAPAILVGSSISVPIQNISLQAFAAVINPTQILTGTEAPLLGTAGTTDFTGWDRIQNASVDDNSIEVTGWPFTFTIDSTGYTSAFVGSNSYITFGAGSGVFSSLSASNPNLRKIFFGAADNSYQRVFKKSDVAADGSSIMRIRYEGTAATTGTLGSPNIVVEFAFYQPRSNGAQWIELRIGNHSRTSGLFMIANQTTSYASATITANSSWVFVGNSTGTSWTMTSNRYIG
jgi:hypothetical protein